MNLIENLIAKRHLKTPSIIKAFKKIKRADFLPENLRHLADLDKALPIEKEQTISQPAVVAFMIELLEPRLGDKILDIGSGSGWTTALLAQIVGDLGKVFGVEIIPEIAEFGSKNVRKYGFIKKDIVKIFCSDGSRGFKKEAPFDKILVSAAAEKVPIALKEQLKIGGRLAIPIKNSICIIEKKEDGFKKSEYPGFVFVPLVIKNE